jgi:GR25 family glycosyltransferase involved in LPS biosynthesis
MKKLIQRLFPTVQADPAVPPRVMAGSSGNYCISLNSQAQRLLETRAQLDRYGIKVEHFPGIPSAEVSEKITRIDGVPERAHGTLQAYLNLFNHLVATQPAAKGTVRPYVAVFEDDIILLDTFSQLDDCLAWVPDDWDFISLGGNFHQTHPEILDHSIIRIICAFNLHAQLIRIDFLPRLIAHLSTRAFEVDVITSAMQQQRIGNWYGFTHDFVWQHARSAYYCVSLWEHQLGLYHFAKANGIIDHFLIKGLLRLP